MEVKRCEIESFSVIGKEGSTNDGKDFIKKLWDKVNNHFDEVKLLAKKNETGNFAGFWGAMSDFSRSFAPWENDYSDGFYLAGVEVEDDAEAPKGWTKWVIPSFDYLYVKVENDIPSALSFMLDFIEENDFKLAGAIHEYFCSEEKGQLYLFFPIRKLK